MASSYKTEAADAALRASIAKWEQRVAGTYTGPDSREGCPLCQLYDPHGANGCAGCPVAAKTGMTGCDGSPYEKWQHAPNGTDMATEAAREELESLRSLLVSPPAPPPSTRPLTIYAEPRARLGLTVEEVEFLMTLAEHHYDATCRNSVRVGGFLFGWSNSLIAASSFPDADPPEVVAEWHQLDCCLQSREGWVGPRDVDPRVEALLEAGRGHSWRTGPSGVLDNQDDCFNEWSYEGQLIEITENGTEVAYRELSAEALGAPLDHLGTPDAGDAVIQNMDGFGDYQLALG